MKFECIFDEIVDPNVYAVCYPEDKKGGKNVNIFKKKFKMWDDTEYLRNFFVENEPIIKNAYWRLSISAAIDKVREERKSFLLELGALETNTAGYGRTRLEDIFLQFHREGHALESKNMHHRRAAPNVNNPMLRLYAVELLDKSYIITGGGIKLVNPLDPEAANIQMENFERVEKYLKNHHIGFKDGLLED